MNLQKIIAMEDPIDWLKPLLVAVTIIYAFMIYFATGSENVTNLTADYLRVLFVLGFFYLGYKHF